MCKEYAYALLLLCVATARCQFSEHFEQFILRTRGNKTLQLLKGKGDSDQRILGGRMGPKDIVIGRPLLIVNGIEGWKKTITLRYFADLLKQYGYNATQIYGIVPAAGIGIPSNIMQMKCAYFKQVRLLVELIYSYVLVQVDIISTGAGTAVARKAILGGACLDENENLGKPITNKVNTFIAVGGVCYGSEACSNENSCTGPNSLNCYSTLLEELNRQPSRFEGTLSYALYSYSDEVIGSECCWHQCGQLRHANAIFVYNKLDHRSLIERTVHKQFELLIGNATTAVSSRLYQNRNTPERNLPYSVVAYFIQLFVVIVVALCLVTFLKSKKYSRLWR